MRARFDNCHPSFKLWYPNVAHYRTNITHIYGIQRMAPSQYMTIFFKWFIRPNLYGSPSTTAPLSDNESESDDAALFLRDKNSRTL
jgi:hypothetical protein